MTTIRTLDQISITRSHSVSRNTIYLACSPDEDDAGYPFNRLSYYNGGEWIHYDYELWIAGITRFKDHDGERTVLVGSKGEFVDLNDPETLIPVFAFGTKTLDSPGFGHLVSISQIGSHLYICGDSGQNYKRQRNGTWIIFIEDLLEVKGNSSRALILERLRNPDLANDSEFNKKLSLAIANDATSTYQHMTGLYEDGIYLCGGKGNISSVLTYYDGNTVTELPIEYGIEKEFTPSLNHIIFEDGEDKMRICGQQGAMLIGNKTEGFKQDPAATEDVLYYNMAQFQERIYIASNYGLLIHDGTQIRRVRTGMEPDAIDTHTVQAVDDVLWVIGSKDILRFDGQAWERIPYPGNDPL